MGKKILDTEIKSKYTVETIKWCEENLGISTRKKRDLIVVLSERARKKGKYIIYGNYCFFRNKIVIYEPNCVTLYDLVATIIHEYTHYLQSRSMYKKYEESYYYSTNPYERQARRNEKKHTKQCISDIKKLI